MVTKGKVVSTDKHNILLFIKDTEENRLREKRKTTPHLWNLNEDPQLTGVVVHFIDQGIYYNVLDYLSTAVIFLLYLYIE